MKRIAFIVFMLAMSFWTISGLCQTEKDAEPNRLFYQGNTYYKAGDYSKALLAYNKALETGLESGNLYYNIGNSFFKLNKLGYAILFYEKARRLMPSDSDLRSNIEFARMLAGESSYDDISGNRILQAAKQPFVNFSLNDLAIAAISIYLVTTFLIGLVIVNPIMGKRFAIILVLAVAICMYTITVFALRYYGEAIQRYGIILTKGVECRYEPIDKSAVYFKLPEGSEVRILASHDGWRQIKRSDAKVGWVKKEAVEAI